MGPHELVLRAVGFSKRGEERYMNMKIFKFYFMIFLIGNIKCMFQIYFHQGSPLIFHLWDFKISRRGASLLNLIK